MPPNRPGEADTIAKTRVLNTWSGGSPSNRTRETQSRGFLRSGAIEALYSGAAMRTPSCTSLGARTWRPSSGARSPRSKSPPYRGNGLTPRSARVGAMRSASAIWAASRASFWLWEPSRAEPAKNKSFCLWGIRPGPVAVGDPTDYPCPVRAVEAPRLTHAQDSWYAEPFTQRPVFELHLRFGASCSPKRLHHPGQQDFGACFSSEASCQAAASAQESRIR